MEIMCKMNLEKFKNELVEYEHWIKKEANLETEFIKKGRELRELGILYTHETLPEELKEIQEKIFQAKRIREVKGIVIADLALDLKEEGCEMKKL